MRLFLASIFIIVAGATLYYLGGITIAQVKTLAIVAGCLAVASLAPGE